MHRVAHAEARKVIYDGRVAKHRRERRCLADVLFKERDVAFHIREVVTLPVHEVVDDDDAQAVSCELTHQLGADETGATGDDDRRAAHDARAPLSTSICSNSARSTGVKR